MTNSATTDPRTAGWTFRLVPATRLRTGDIVERCLLTLTVSTITRLDGDRISVTFHDDSTVVYGPPSRTTMVSRWRAPKCERCGATSRTALTEGGLTFRLCVPCTISHTPEDDGCDVEWDEGASAEYAALLPVGAW